MYLLTEHDKWFIGQMHAQMSHDCDIQTCQLFFGLETAYLEAKNEEQKRLELLSTQG